MKFCGAFALALLVLVVFLLSSSKEAFAAEPVIEGTTAKQGPTDPNCSLEHYLGVSYEDATAIEEVLCSEAKSQAHGGANFRVRISKLGGQIVIRVTADRSASGGRSTDKQLMVSTPEEVVVAAPRLITAALDDRHVDETRNVDNVVGGEVRTTKSQKARINAAFGVVGAGMLGFDPSAGVMMAISAGDARWAFVGDLRLTGDAFDSIAGVPVQVGSLGLWKPSLDAASSFGSLSGGVRHHFSADSTSFFATMGIGLDHVAVREANAHLKNTGLGAFAEAGLDVLRTNSIGGTIALRLDAPMFAARGTRTEGSPEASNEPWRKQAAGGKETKVETWLPVGSVVFAMRF